jgi:hypothetical protein
MAARREEPYIMEEFIEGTIVSYDGIADGESTLSMKPATFPMPNYVVVNQLSDDYYYTDREVPVDLSDYGRRVIKAFGSKPHFSFGIFPFGQRLSPLGQAGPCSA